MLIVSRRLDLRLVTESFWHVGCPWEIGEDHKLVVIAFRHLLCTLGSHTRRTEKADVLATGTGDGDGVKDNVYAT